MSGLWVLPLVLTVPAYVANVGSYLLGVTQHCGLRESVPDFRKNTRSIKLNPLLEFLYWHMNWHVEHHMYAGVPCYNLKALAKEIKHDMPQPLSLLGAWIEMRQIFQRQKIEHHYQFDVLVPDAAPTINSEVDDRLAMSIGDIAPKELVDEL